MTISDLRMNIVFACIVGALGATAATFMYRNSGLPASREAPASGSASEQLPKNHPPVDLASRLSDLEHLIVKDPQNADYQTQVGDIYYDLAQYEKAADSYQRSLKLRPQDQNVETDLAACLYYLGRYDKALEILNKVLEYSPGFPQAMFNKGIVLVGGKQDVKGGLAVWEDLLRSHSEFAKRVELEQKIRQLKASIK